MEKRLTNDEVREIAREDIGRSDLMAFLDDPEIGDFFFSESRQTWYWNRYDGNGWVMYPGTGPAVLEEPEWQI